MKQRLRNSIVFKCSWVEIHFYQFSIARADFKVKITTNNCIYDISSLHQRVSLIMVKSLINIWEANALIYKDPITADERLRTCSFCTLGCTLSWFWPPLLGHSFPLSFVEAPHLPELLAIGTAWAFAPLSTARSSTSMVYSACALVSGPRPNLCTRLPWPCRKHPA